MRQRGPWLKLKRAMDLSVAVPAALVLSPVIAGTSVAIFVSLGRPILFRQTRIGRGEREFRIYKFRTMKPGAPDASPDEDHLRITPLGAWLRATSIDELPQLLNILKGEMSIVGPRPLLTRYLPRYSARQRRRQEVMPGLTGWSQIHGRNSADWADKLERDVWYVEHWSPGLDVSIVLRTLLTVLDRSGVSAEGHATMPEFMGNEATVR